MSNALSRLREHFEDELLVAVGRRMEPTPRAQALAPAVRELLVRIDNTMQVQPRFDPQKTDRTFRIAASDYSMAVYIPHVLRVAESDEATANFEFLPLVGAATESLDRGTADVLVIPQRHASLDHPTTPIFDDSFSCLVGADHPKAGGSLKRDEYLAAGHVVMQPVQARGPSIDGDFFLERGLVRRTEVTAYSFSMLAPLLQGTQRIATVQRRLIDIALQYLPVAEVKPDFEMPSIDQCVQWHRLRASDPGLLWLRDVMMKAARHMPRP